jgi:hypothetical protein
MVGDFCRCVIYVLSVSHVHSVQLKILAEDWCTSLREVKPEASLASYFDFRTQASGSSIPSSGTGPQFTFNQSLLRWILRPGSTFKELKSAREILEEAGGPDILLTASQVYSMLEYHGLDPGETPNNSVRLPPSPPPSSSFSLASTLFFRSCIYD